MVRGILPTAWTASRRATGHCGGGRSSVHDGGDVEDHAGFVVGVHEGGQSRDVGGVGGESRFELAEIESAFVIDRDGEDCAVAGFGELGEGFGGWHCVRRWR